MSGKQIFAVSASFIVGGILGFLLHGQLVKDNLIGNGNYPHGSYNTQPSSSGIYDSDKGYGESKSLYGNTEWRKKINPQAVSAIDETLRDMNLSDEQYSKIERIIQQNMPPNGDLSKMSKTNMMKAAYHIRKELNPEQQEILQSAIIKHAGIAIPNF